MAPALHNMRLSEPRTAFCYNTDMAENKTQPTNESVDEFLGKIDNNKRREDSIALVELMHEVTGVKPVLWGNIVGFGKYHYKYASGREGDIMAVGFAPRKQALTIYGVLYYEQNADRMADLGDVQTSKGCIYIKDLNKINMPILRELVAAAYKQNNNS